MQPLTSLEKTGKNVDDAIVAALAELGKTRDEVDITVLDEGNKGLFGILGGKDARVLVSVKDTPLLRAQRFLSDLFDCMGVDATPEISLDEDVLSIDLQGENMGILIGKHGETLDAIQYLTSLVINKGDAPYLKVSLDAENYRTKRNTTLEVLARRIAAKVEKSQRRYILEPMSPYERRIIHATLQDNPAVVTHSIGNEPNRKVVVVPKNDARSRS